MPRIIVPADEVKEGEPRWYCESYSDAKQLIRDGLDGPLHVTDRKGEWFESCGWAIVDRPAPTRPAGEPPVEPFAWCVMQDQHGSVHVRWFDGDDAELRAKRSADGFGGTAAPVYLHADRAADDAVRAHVAGDGLDLAPIKEAVATLTTTAYTPAAMRRSAIDVMTRTAPALVAEVERLREMIARSDHAACWRTGSALLKRAEIADAALATARTRVTALAECLTTVLGHLRRGEHAQAEAAVFGAFNKTEET